MFLIGMLVLFLFVLASCGNTADKSNNQTQNEEQAEDSNSVEDKEEQTEDSNTGKDNVEKDEAENTPEEKSTKEEYVTKLNETKKEMDEMRKNPEDNSTYALKAVEGIAFDTWDALLNEIYGVLKKQLSSEEMEQLRKEQREWIVFRDNSAKEASLKYEGGTMEQLEYVVVLNNLTEERCFELVKLYMK